MYFDLGLSTTRSNPPKRHGVLRLTSGTHLGACAQVLTHFVIGRDVSNPIQNDISLSVKTVRDNSDGLRYVDLTLVAPTQTSTAD